MKRSFLLILSVSAAILFASLGFWQLERRSWKNELVSRVASRVHAPPAPIVNRPILSDYQKHDEYRRVRVSGEFLHDRATLIDALTELGPGFWIMTPLSTPSGFVLINRGFVPRDKLDKYDKPKGTVFISGLLRSTEPDGRILRPNQAAADRWYSRDVHAIAQKRQVGKVAPFFIDAEQDPFHKSYPVGSLTVVNFRNMHLAYALTWFSLMILALFGASYIFRHPAETEREQ